MFLSNSKHLWKHVFPNTIFLFLKIVYKKCEQNHREFGDDIGFKTDQTKKCRTQKDEKLDFYKNK